MIKIGFVLVALGGLAACDATGGPGREGSPLWNMRHMSFDARIGYFTSKCEKLGYQRDTDAMRDCVAEEMRQSE